MAQRPGFAMAFTLDNAEFETPAARAEGVARLLRETANRVDAGHTDGVLFDINGNKIGKWGFDGD
jgi:hypothetical protein